MSTAGNGRELSKCGCCEGGAHAPEITNRPGQPSIDYRLGTHPMFLARMIAALPMETIPDGSHHGSRPLYDLTTRSTSDASIALLDAFAVVEDVLTFYQERIANEAYLRTATERRSILELARSIGYELSPGVAAGTYLSFSVDTADGAPHLSEVPRGTQVQSIPSQGKLPQTFETAESFTAHVERNRLRPRRALPQNLSSTVDRVWIEGGATGLEKGALLLLRHSGTTSVRRVLSVTTLEDRTRVDLEGGSPASNALTDPPPAEFHDGDLALNETNVRAHVLAWTWEEKDLSAFLDAKGWDRARFVELVEELTTDAPLGEAHAFRARVGFFGHNAPLWATLPVQDNPRGTDPYASTDWDSTARTIWQDSKQTDYNAAGARVFLERLVPQIVPGSWVVVELGPLRSAYQVSAALEQSRVDYALSAKVTGLDLTPTTKSSLFKVRTSAAHVTSESLPLATRPWADPVQESSTQGALTVGLERIVLGLKVGQPVTITGERVDAPGIAAGEVAFLERIYHAAGRTTLQFTGRLRYRYTRESLTINANTVRSTHGESVDEVVGSGDGSAMNQTFTLRKPPLTYVSAATPSGIRSSLELRVNGILWGERPSLFGQDARSEVFAIRHDDDGNVTVVFGDGRSGARVPSGTENVSATYRTGIGPDGEVDAGSLTLLKKKPYGIRSVTNPLPAEGAAAPESLSEARGNAPLKVLTLDRIVSLQDYGDFARAFPGLGKAQATPVWDGEVWRVHITIASAAGTQVDPASDLYRNLLAVIDGARDPGPHVQVEGYQPRSFDLDASIRVDGRFLREEVESAVEAALTETFAFERRCFAQPVTAAEVIEVIQQVEGVEAVDLNALTLDGESAPPPAPGCSGEAFPRAVLPSRPARPDGLAELLLINPSGITLREMTG